MADSSRKLVERFIWRQSYGKSFGAFRDLQLAARSDMGRAGHRWALPLGLSSAIARLPWPVDWANAVDATSGVSWRNVQALLYNALGILRREPSNPYNDHRAFPSPRCLFPTHAYLVCAGAGRTFHYNPVQHALETMGDPDSEDVRPPESTWSTTMGGMIAIASRYTQIPKYYRDLRYTLAVLEAGHSLYNIALIAAALRIRVRIYFAFDDATVLRRLCLPARQGWAPVALVALGDATADAEARILKGPDDSEGETSERWAIDDSSEDDRLADVDAACWLATSECEAWRRRVPTAPRRVPKEVVAACDVPGVTRNDLATVLFERNAGRGNGGVSGALTAIPRRVLASACREGFRPIPSDLSGSAWSLVGLRVLLAAERVETLDDGLYELFPCEAALTLVRPGRWLADVQRAFSPRSGIYIASFNIAWFLVVDYGLVIEDRGPRGFRLVNLELGWIAQGIACAMAAEGLFARPCRSYREPLLDDLLGLASSETVGYQVLCGINRFRDLVLDIRC